jgi:hypothetical protein
MTAFDRIEQRMPELMAELAPATVPDYFDDMLRQTGRTRQRPAWASLERWLPMDVVARPSPFRAPVLRPLMIVILVGLLVGAALALYAGSHQTRLPAPFGPARNGSLFFADADGVIHSFDPTTEAQTAIVTGPDPYFGPMPSRNGQRLAFHSGVTVGQVLVADVDGSNVHAVDGTYIDFQEMDWSPDDQQLAIISTVDGVRSVSIAEADGSGAATLHLDRDVNTARYLPDGRLAFIGAQGPGTGCGGPADEPCALLVVNADGTGLQVILPGTSFMGLGLSPTADGSSLIYPRWGADEHGTVHMVDIASGQDRVLPVDGMALGVIESNRSYLSPDGNRILFDQFEASGDHWAVAPVAGGPPVSIGPEWPDGREGTYTQASWSPDGASIIAFYPTLSGDDELWLLDPTGQREDRRLPLPVNGPPTWQRIAQ